MQLAHTDGLFFVSLRSSVATDCMEPDAASPRPEKRTSAGESTLSPALRKFQKQGAMVARLSTLQSASATLS